MTTFYQTNSWSNPPSPSKDYTDLCKHLTNNKNCRIVELINGYYQTEYQDLKNQKVWNDVTRRETLKQAEDAIDETVAYYSKKVEFLNGPKVVKTFK